MKESTKKVLRFFERKVRIRVERETDRWPPVCRGALHQPKRPKKS